MADISYDDDDDDDYEEREAEEDQQEPLAAEEEETGAGLGAAVLKILSTDVSGDPVLAKRKLKEAEPTKRRKVTVDKEAMAKKIGQALRTEDHAKEKEYRKTATRAVVALFNAISKHQYGQADDASSVFTATTSTSKKSAYEEKVAAVKQVQQDTLEQLNRNSWAREDYLLDAKAGDGWDEEDDQAAQKKRRKDDASGTNPFLYSSGRPKARV